MDDILLLIEDELMIADLLQTVAEGVGYHVNLADSIETIESTISAAKPSLVLMDLNLPNVDTEDILQRLAALNVDANVIVASGSEMGKINAVLERGRTLGLNMHSAMQKPFDIVTLEAVLSELRR